jgi:predicted Holliday junction resolvase-like endonuclease
MLVGWMGIQTGQARSEEELGRLKAEKEAADARFEESERMCLSYVQHLHKTESELKKVKSQKKSSEVRTGLIAEQMAPFLEGFPYSPKNAIFLGKPLDFLVFDEDGVHFVEVKSGNAQLNANQRRIRNQLNEKKVTFEVYRIKGE